MPALGTAGTAIGLSDVQAWIESQKASTQVTASMVSGKLVLRIALDRVATFYRIG